MSRFERAVRLYLSIHQYAQVHQVAWTLGASPTTTYDALVRMRKAGLVVDQYEYIKAPTLENKHARTRVRLWVLTGQGSSGIGDIDVAWSHQRTGTLSNPTVGDHESVRHRLLINEHVLALHLAGHATVTERVILSSEGTKVGAVKGGLAFAAIADARRYFDWTVVLDEDVAAALGSRGVKTHTPDGGFVEDRHGVEVPWHVEVELHTKTKKMTVAGGSSVSAEYRGWLGAVRTGPNGRPTHGQVFFAPLAETRKAIVDAARSLNISGAWEDQTGGTWSSTDNLLIVRPLLSAGVADRTARAYPTYPNIKAHPLGWADYDPRPQSLSRADWEVKPSFTDRTKDAGLRARRRATRAATLAQKKAATAAVQGASAPVSAPTATVSIPVQQAASVPPVVETPAPVEAEVPVEVVAPAAPKVEVPVTPHRRLATRAAVGAAQTLLDNGKTILDEHLAAGTARDDAALTPLRTAAKKVAGVLAGADVEAVALDVAVAELRSTMTALPAPVVQTVEATEWVEARTYIATVIDQANAAARDGLDVTGLRAPIEALKKVIAIHDDLEALSEARHAVAAAMVTIADQKATAKIAMRRQRTAPDAPAAQVTAPAPVVTMPAQRLAPAGKPMTPEERTELNTLVRQQVLARHGRRVAEDGAYPADLLVEVASEIRRLTSMPTAA